MSNIRADTLSTLDGTKSITTDRVTQGVARAWVNFNGTGTVAIRASFNVSSITDNGVGDYTVNFATAMPDANYSAVSGTSVGTGSDTRMAITIRDSSAVPTTTSIRFGAVNIGVGSFQDTSFNNVAIFR